MVDCRSNRGVQIDPYISLAQPSDKFFGQGDSFGFIGFDNNADTIDQMILLTKVAGFGLRSGIEPLSPKPRTPDTFYQEFKGFLP
jgi:hypothetical protein